MEVEASDVVILSTIFVCNQPTSSLFDQGSAYSYSSTYYASLSVLSYEILYVPMCMATSVGGFLVVNWVYRSLMVTFQECHTQTDLIMLDMIDFDVILRMD